MKPTIEFAGMTLEANSPGSVVVTHYNGARIPKGAVGLYTLPDGSVNPNVHRRVIPHPDFGHIREMVLTVPPEMIRDLHKQHCEWECARCAAADTACRPIADKAIAAADAAYAAYQATLATIRHEHGLDYVSIDPVEDSDAMEIKVTLNHAETGQRRTFTKLIGD